MNLPDQFDKKYQGYCFVSYTDFKFIKYFKNKQSFYGPSTIGVPQLLKNSEK